MLDSMRDYCHNIVIGPVEETRYIHVSKILAKLGIFLEHKNKENVLV